MATQRNEVSLDDRWNVEAMYPNFDAWNQDFKSAYQEQHPRWPELSKYKEKLGDSPEALKSALENFFSISRKLSNLYTYSHLRHDEDITNDQHKVALMQITSILHDFEQESAWLEPEILALPVETISQYQASQILTDYHFHLEKILRLKKHILSPEKEELMALAGKALEAPHKAFSAINDADFKFGLIKDGQGKEHELTHATYGLYVRDQDRKLRENAYKTLHKQYHLYENTLCELLNGEVQSHLFNAKARYYSSSLEATLFSKNIDVAVYHALIQAVEENIEKLHQYVQLREQILGIGPLHLYDMAVPLTSEVDIKMPYKEAEDLVIESVAPLGAEYQNLLKKGLKDQRWVDRYENENKRSGAYSSGSYDSPPYILLNYKGILRDVFTLAHEVGHSMHSLLSHKNQPYQYGSYPIFLAEVASTFNEELLMRLMLERAQSHEEKIFLVNQKIEDIRSTLFRQTMFAEFELFIHEMAEKNIPLTPKLLKEKFLNLNTKYFGKRVIIDPEAEIEWARIPHFYYNFYVYQYATGISAALALSERVLKGGEAERNDYLSFLKSGCSRYPIDILRKAGVDMCSPQPVKAAIDKFGDLVTQLDKLAVKQANC